MNVQGTVPENGTGLFKARARGETLDRQPSGNAGKDSGEELFGGTPRPI